MLGAGRLRLQPAGGSGLLLLLLLLSLPADPGAFPSAHLGRAIRAKQRTGIHKRGGSASLIALFEARRSSPAGRMMVEAKLLLQIRWEGAWSPTRQPPTPINSSHLYPKPSARPHGACSLHETPLPAQGEDRIKLLPRQSLVAGGGRFRRRFRLSFCHCSAQTPLPGRASPGALAWLTAYERSCGLGVLCLLFLS